MWYRCIYLVDSFDPLRLLLVCYRSQPVASPRVAVCRCDTCAYHAHLEHTLPPVVGYVGWCSSYNYQWLKVGKLPRCCCAPFNNTVLLVRGSLFVSMMSTEHLIHLLSWSIGFWLRKDEHNYAGCPRLSSLVFFISLSMTILSVNNEVTYFLNDEGDYRCYIYCTQDIFPIVLGPVSPCVFEETDCPFWTHLAVCRRL